jgi:type III secretion protein J
MLRQLVLFPFLLLLISCGSTQLRSGLSEKDAEEIVVLLHDHGLSARAERETGEKKDTPTWQVKVFGGSERLTTAWRILAENGLPREPVKGLHEVFASAGMIPTAGEEKARLLVGLSGELTRTLNSVAGIVDSRVQVVLPENSPLLDKSEWSPTTASVLVKYQGASPPLKEEEIKKLVSTGVEGLKPENVGVVFNRVVAKPAPPFDPLSWGIEQLTGVSLLLACILGIGSLVLTFRLRTQTARVEQLKKELARVTASGSQTGPRLMTGGAGKS